MEINVDIIIPVYNNLSLVKDCLSEVIKCTNESVNMFIIDDHSDSITNNYLKRVSEKHHNVFYHKNTNNMGFVKTCNKGFSLGKSPFVVFLNSDVIVTPHWLERMIACMESDPKIALVNPFTNYAANINIPIAPGANVYSMDEVLRKQNYSYLPDIVTGVGFCMLLRRSIIEKVGLFDEIYGKGYCEESDLCMRLTTQGYRTVVADNVYVYHKGRSSFSDRDERYFTNRKIFDKRWKKEYDRQYRVFMKNNPLKPMRDIFALPTEWDPIPAMRQTYRLMRNSFRKKEYKSVVKEGLRGLKRTIKNRRPLINDQYVQMITRPNRLTVTYLLPHLVVAGGVLSVIQLVNELILLGVEARIVALKEYPEVYDWKFYTKPIIFKSEKELLDHFPKSDIVVATHWTTARLVHELERLGRAKTTAYFLQDYESWFYEENDIRRQAVKETYKLIENKIVKSTWLKELLLNDGYKTTQIRLGMDLGIFYPRDVSKQSSTIMAMARPRTPYRGYKHVIEALKLVKEKLPESKIILFGSDLSKENIPFEYESMGVVTNQNMLAELYSSADVYLDGSDFQGFGRPALEAMACACPTVLTDVGGVNEYAIQEQNCILVPPRNPERFAEAILKVLEDKKLKDKLISNGLETVKQYCHKREAKETLEYFKRVLYKRS